ncbi:MAG: hypothetical protein BA863_07745 [Desulfovibrio sp. S3730MH75]|nr:MAG: hypothetical protein BA863_07745 [Desulfovibrio sp. S3730MH75]
MNTTDSLINNNPVAQNTIPPTVIEIIKLGIIATVDGSCKDGEFNYDDVTVSAAAKVLTQNPDGFREICIKIANAKASVEPFQEDVRAAAESLLKVSSETYDGPEYIIRDNATYRIVEKRDGLKEEMIANFDVKIVKETKRIYNSGKTDRFYELECLSKKNVPFNHVTIKSTEMENKRGSSTFRVELT